MKTIILKILIAVAAAAAFVFVGLINYKAPIKNTDSNKQIHPKKTTTTKTAGHAGDNLAMRWVKVNDKEKGVVIIIDDIGENLEVVREILSISNKITMSVIPGTKHDVESVKLINENNGRAMIHMPMMPHNRKLAVGSSWFIGPSISKIQIESKVGEAIMRLKGTVGLNNHMGSLATEDEGTMKTVIKKLKENNMFFIDSLTSSKSVAYKTASSEVNHGKRDVFLDHYNEVDKIEEAWQKLQDCLKRKNVCVAIGHPRPLTIESLKRHIHQFALLNVEQALLPPE